MFLFFFIYLLGLSIFYNVMLMTLRISNYVSARNFGQITYQEHITLSNKRYDDVCSVYCDKHGCTHKSYLKPYFKYVQSIDIKKHSLKQYQRDNLMLYIIIFPVLFYSVIYSILKK